MGFLAGEKQTKNGGYFLIPTGPAAGTAVASSASANTYGSWVEMTAATSADIFVVGVIVGADGTLIDYLQFDIGTGAGGSESSVGETKFDIDNAAAHAGGPNNLPAPVLFPFPIPVANGVRIACRTADNVASALSHKVTLWCINQSDVVNMG